MDAKWSGPVSDFLKSSLLRVKPRLGLIAMVLFSVLGALWVLHTPRLANDSGLAKNANDDEGEIGLLIPKGFVIVPLELSNAPSLSAMVSSKAIFDLFVQKSAQPVVRHLRVIKLSAGDGPLFGALVPENWSGRAQQVFADKTLKAAIQPPTTAPTVFNLQTRASSRPLVEEISTSGEEP